MKRNKLRRFAKRISERLKEKGYKYWNNKNLEKHERFCSKEEVFDGEKVQISCSLLEDEPDYLQIGISLSSESSFLDSYFPVGYSVIIEKDTS